MRLGRFSDEQEASWRKSNLEVGWFLSISHFWSWILIWWQFLPFPVAWQWETWKHSGDKVHDDPDHDGGGHDHGDVGDDHDGCGDNCEDHDDDDGCGNLTFNIEENYDFFLQVEMTTATIFIQKRDRSLWFFNELLSENILGLRQWLYWWQ